MFVVQSGLSQVESRRELRSALGQALRVELGLEVRRASSSWSLGVARAAVGQGVAWPLRNVSWTVDSAEVAIRQALRKQGQASLLQAATVGEVSSKLAEAGVVSLAYKGVALSAQTTGNLAARAPVDIDLLVGPGSVSVAHRVLVGMGWSVKPGTLPVPTREGDLTQRLTCEIGFAGRKPTIDLHWRTEPTRATLDISFEQMWAESVEVSAGATTIRTLSPVHALLATAVHGTRSRWASWKWIVDAARQIYGPQAPALGQAYGLAGRVGSQRSLQLAHCLAADLLDELPPDNAPARMQRLGRQVWTGQWSQTVVRQPGHWVRDLPASVAEFADRERWRYVTADSKRAAMTAAVTPFLRRGVSTFRHT